MATGTLLSKRVMKVYSAETWARARELYCGGMSLEAVGKKLGIPYSTVRDHGWTEEWGVRGKGVQRDPRAEQRKARRIKAKLAREEALMIVETSLVKAEELEVIARQWLVADSARMKVVISRKVGEILQRLDPSVPPRSAAQAIGALAPIFRLLYKWQDEPSEADLKAAKGPNHAINIALIQTAPEELRMMGPHREDASLQTEQKDQLDGTRLIEDAPIPAPAGDGDHLPKKEAPNAPPPRSHFHAGNDDHSPQTVHKLGGDGTLSKEHTHQQSAGDGRSLPKKEDPLPYAPNSSTRVTQPQTNEPRPFGTPDPAVRARQLEELDRQRSAWRAQRCRS